MTKASDISQGLRSRLEQIKPANGYHTELQRVYGPTEKPTDKAPLPLALIRPQHDAKTSAAGVQATRVRTYEIEVQFSKSADEAALSAVHVDILRALGFGQDQPERKFPGLLEEDDQAEFRFASAGETTHSITLIIGVLYVESYN
ncbi:MULTISPECIES: hypothetical protein [Stutzerimonas stutzeri subgroup]|uniref:Phage protein n=1 Tax=Stutzerimonas stutzeri CCUG 29243 TaxID=1196835 RepID=I4CRC5_STUST|nr:MULTISPECIES: hypothetical protein [Stutzerimonas stutzeri subgroup]AFM32632.1 hypothetical protein A458_06930 [Stutzerimonas stutzeri CCUG 29243]MCQ2040271.1 hypothetical protein [Stutzerimonas kunmingensis]QSH74584.1 hypothetical protein pAN_10 [Pseudomonas phage vB_PstS-pAN]